MKAITIWERLNDDDKWEHNHIQDGHVEDEPMLPDPLHPAHNKAWKRGVWKFTHAHLSDHTPPKIIR